MHRAAVKRIINIKFRLVSVRVGKCVHVSILVVCVALVRILACSLN